jgi:type IV secretion system protein TrbH
MIQRPNELTVLLILFLAGCASTSDYGSFVENDSVTYNQVIAGDVAGQLMQLYPPASTKFNLQHNSEDGFGAVLIQNLRVSGYAIQENQPSKLYRPGRNTNTRPSHNKKTAARTKQRPAQNKVTVTPEEGTALAYVLDHTSDVYRLSVMVDNKILTRAYRPYKDSIYPAGSWARRQ